MKKKLRTFLIWVLLILLCVTAFLALQDREPAPFIDYEMFKKYVNAGRVSKVELSGKGALEVTLEDGGKFFTMGELDEEALKDLQRRQTFIGKAGAQKSSSVSWPTLAIVAAVVLAIFLFLRKMGGGSMMGITTFLKSKARLLPESRTSTFADVGGCPEAKEALLDLVDFLKQPRRWEAAGARVPRGMLLEGPPGCGKTLLARAVAGEARAKFFFVSASEFVEMFVGVGAARVRDTFESAAREKPSVIFIDELDAVARHRGSGVGGSHDEREQTLNQLLVCLDGLQGYDQVVVLAATNRPDILDSALLRPGRFDRIVHIGRPSSRDRNEILRIHTRGKPLAPDVSLEELVELTEAMKR